MSASVPENVPAASTTTPTQPVATTPAAIDANAAAAEPTRAPLPRHKFDNVGKTVGSKAKNFLSTLHQIGEHLRGNINAAIDGAGDAIANRKSGDAKARASTAQTETITPVVPATAEENATAPAAFAPETPAHNNSETSPAEPDKVGQFFNKSFKRTSTLVTRVGSNLRSTAVRTVDQFGKNIDERKAKASKRFSKGPKTTDDAPAAPEEAPIPSTTTPAETVTAPAAAEVTPVVAATA